jgi:hypothetical protein
VVSGVGGEAARVGGKQSVAHEYVRRKKNEYPY